MRIAMLEDEPSQAQVMREWLTAATHVCHIFESGRRLLSALRRESFDLLMLDWHVPDRSGIDVLRVVRNDLSLRMPVLFVTARATESDVAEALSAGADDYIVKPPRRLELVARVNALWRRVGGADPEPAILECPPYRLDLRTRRVFVDDAQIELTPKEFDLAWLLFRNPDRLLSRGHLLERVWGQSAEVTTRTVDSHVSRIRSKLGLRPERGFRLVSEYAIGYRLLPVHGG